MEGIYTSPKSVPPTCPSSTSGAAEQRKAFSQGEGWLSHLERGEVKIFEKESPYFKVATLDMAEDCPHRLRCALLLSAGVGTVPELPLGHHMWVTHWGGGQGACL